MDRWDFCVIAGLALVVASVYLTLDWPGLVGLVGLILVGLGWLGAGTTTGTRKGNKQR